MNPTTTLRWRARVTKEAFLHDDDNYEHSNYDRWEIPNPTTTTGTSHHPTTTTNNNDTNSVIVGNPLFTTSRAVSTIVIDTFAAMAIGASVYVGLQWFLMGYPTSTTTTTIPSSTIASMFRFGQRMVLGMACTMTFGLSILVMRQERKQQQWGRLRQIYSTTRRTVRSLQQQNERLCRSLTALDRTLDRLPEIEAQIRPYLTTTTTTTTTTSSQQMGRLISVVQKYKQLQPLLQQQLLMHTQEQLLFSVLVQVPRQDKEHQWSKEACIQQWMELFQNPNHNNTITTTTTLRNWIYIQENNLRNLFQYEAKKQLPTNDTITMEQIMSLLQQLRHDLNTSSLLLLLSKSSQNNKNNNNNNNAKGMWLDDNNDDDDDDNDTNGIVFQLQPRQQRFLSSSSSSQSPLIVLE